ncbi:MAG TPA: GMC oxidoreductase, partial [Alphaproteobacteria bacterium]|nr:GMC oxidoreductase [Alphaproteobacteria bacterium]
LDGVGPVQATQYRGRRWSAADGYLRPARGRPNLRIESGAHATRLRLDRGRATGIEYRQRGAEHFASCRAEVLLATGTIASPQILMLSGIGPAETLGRAGVPVRHELPGVGANLRDHVGVYLSYEVDLPTYNNEQGLLRKLKHGANWALFGRGPGTTPGAHAVAFVRTAADSEVPDVQILMTPVGYELRPDELVILKESVVTFVPNVSHPRSRGRVSIRSPDPLVSPVIECRLLDDPYDLERLVAGCRKTREICRTPPLKDHIVRELAPGLACDGDDDWEAFLRSNAVTVFHPVGTCSLGSGPMAVVDADLRVRGLGGVRVVDASVMPTLINGNINATVIAIAERASDLILADRRKCGAAAA